MRNKWKKVSREEEQASIIHCLPISTLCTYTQQTDSVQGDRQHGAAELCPLRPARVLLVAAP